MFFDRKRLKKHTKIVFVILIFVLSAGLILSSMQWIGAPPAVTNTADNQGDTFTQEDVEKFFQQEIDKTQEELKADPENTEKMAQLATLYMYKGDIDKAVDTLNGILEIEPDNIDARINLASLYFSNNKKDEAVKQLNTVLEKHPDNDVALINLAYIYFSGEEYDQAEEKVKKVLAKDDKNLQAVQLYAQILAYGREDYQGAVKQMEKYLELSGAEGSAAEQIKQVIEEWKEKANN